MSQRVASVELPLPPQEARLIDATLACMGRWGVAKTTLDDVARRAGCSRATVYRVFPGGKDSLLAATVRSEVLRFLEPYLERETLRAGVDPHEASEYVARILLSFISAQGRWDLTDRDQVRRLVRTEVIAGIL